MRLQWGLLCLCQFSVQQSTATAFHSFTTREELRYALLHWNDTAAKLQLSLRHGSPEQWNVSAITNMSALLRDLDFNEDISAWDTSSVKDMSFMFYGARSFNRPIGSWNVSGVTNMHAMFYNAAEFNQSVGSWDTSAVQDMSDMFRSAEEFNQDIGSWDTSAVRNMSVMFGWARSFNRPIGSWNVSGVKDMKGMFYSVVEFNQDIGSWDTSALRDMSYMFYEARSFNWPIGSWNVSGVKDMTAVFYNAAEFNQDIGSWETSAVRDMSYMFRGATSFNMPIGSWNVSGVKDMNSMFNHATEFNQDIGSWDTSAVANMRYMFARAASFNMPIGSWNVSGVKAMEAMFTQAKEFNEDIGSWDTSAVGDMGGMFLGAASFNKPIGSWNVSTVTKMLAMFKGATSFDQSLGMWDTSAVNQMDSMFENARSFNQPLSSWNFSGVPLGWNRTRPWDGSGMTSCVRSRTSQALGCPIALDFQAWDLAFEACPACPCRDPTLACVHGKCSPLNSGYIDLGRARWIAEGAFGTVSGFRDCASTCKEAENCSAFLLEDSGRCLLSSKMPGRSQTNDPFRSLAYLKPSCQTFSCRAGTTQRLQGASQASPVTEASCCKCSDPAKVPKSGHTGDLACISCPAGTAPRHEICQACGAGRYARAGDEKCQLCAAGQVPNANRSKCERCPPGEYSESGACKVCNFPFLLQDDTCTSPASSHFRGVDPVVRSVPIKRGGSKAVPEPPDPSSNPGSCMEGHVEQAGHQCSQP